MAAQRCSSHLCHFGTLGSGSLATWSAEACFWLRCCLYRTSSVSSTYDTCNHSTAAAQHPCSRAHARLVLVLVINMTTSTADMISGMDSCQTPINAAQPTSWSGHIDLPPLGPHASHGWGEITYLAVLAADLALQAIGHCHPLERAHQPRVVTSSRAQPSGVAAQKHLVLVGPSR